MALRVEEIHGKDSGILFCPKRVLYHGTSHYQEILVIETEDYGRVLLLDGLVMTTERDEFFYHEALVHPAMQHHPSPRTVLIIGGGDGGALREVLRYREVERAVVVEIDPEVVRVAKEFFPQMASSFEDPRVDLLFEDAARYVEEGAERFDVAIMDTSDPVGPAEVFYREAFFSSLTGVLRPDGVVGIQAESPIFHMEEVRSLYGFVRKGFGTTRAYVAPVPTYPGGLWMFLLAGVGGMAPFRNRVPEGLRFYNGEIHGALFRLPSFLDKALKALD